MTVLEEVGSILMWALVILQAGGELLFLIGWFFWSVSRGLKIRSGAEWSVAIVEDELEMEIGSRIRRLPLCRILRARLATNSNWSESRLVGDALTLFGGFGRLAKIPTSARGFDGLIAALAKRGISIDRVEVPAPAYLD